MTGLSSRVRRNGSRRRGNRILKRLIAVVLAVSLVFVLGGGWYFSGQIYSSGLAIRADDGEAAPTTAADVFIGEIDNGTIAVREADGDQPALRGSGLYGLRWRSGYGQLSGRPRVVQKGGADATVLRKFELLAGNRPANGAAGWLSRAAFPTDPSVAVRVPVRDVTYGSPIGRLRAWYVPGDGATWAILVHGKGAGRDEMLRIMRTTTRLGLPSLAITYRNDRGVPSDPSGRYQYGRTEWRDLEGAVKYATGRGAKKVVLFGASMGGAICAAWLRESDFADSVSALVLDAPMLDFETTVDWSAEQRTLPLIGLPIPRVLTWTAKRLAAARYGIDWANLDYTHQPSWLEVPVLVFHGTADDTVPISSSRELAAAKPALVTLVSVKNADHVASWNADPQAYDRALRTFLQRQ